MMKSNKIIQAIASGNLKRLHLLVSEPNYSVEQWSQNNGLFTLSDGTRQLNEAAFDSYLLESQGKKLVFLSIDTLTDKQLKKYHHE